MRAAGAADGQKRLGRPAQAASANPITGNNHCSQAYAEVSERCAPDASVTASVVTVAKRPAPTKSVGRYCATLTAKPTASAEASAARSGGHFTRRKNHV